MWQCIMTSDFNLLIVRYCTVVTLLNNACSQNWVKFPAYESEQTRID